MPARSTYRHSVLTYIPFLSDPERERLIADVVDRFTNDVWGAWDAVESLVSYERARAKEKP